jgi:hypothetical protein
LPCGDMIAVEFAFAAIGAIFCTADFAVTECADRGFVVAIFSGAIFSDAALAGAILITGAETTALAVGFTGERTGLLAATLPVLLDADFAAIGFAELFNAGFFASILDVDFAAVRTKVFFF